MAIITKNLLGMPHGKLGNYTFRSRYGKLIKYRLPENHRISYSDPAVHGRIAFGMSVRFAKYINSLALLKKLWKYAEVPGSNNFQKIIKHNAAAVRRAGISAANVITPQGISFKINDVIFSRSGISSRIPLYAEELKNLFSQNVFLHIIL